MAATAKVIKLTGNKKDQESAEHIIIFPGGSISVCRTTDNDYWAHIEVNTNQVLEDTVRQSKTGEIVTGRLDYNCTPIQDIDCENLNHLAVRIKTN